jgi:hypothetical protein
MKNKILSFMLLLFSLIVNSCDNFTEPAEVSEFIFETPIVTGMEITKDDPTAIKIWRNPQFPNDIVYGHENNSLPHKISLRAPYPNPNSGFVNIRFELPVKTKIILWIVKARLPEDGEKSFEESSGGNFISSTNKIIAKLIDDELAAGIYKSTWDCSNMPSGFYRVYLKTDSRLFWKDILLARSENDMPADLRQLLKK